MCGQETNIVILNLQEGRVKQRVLCLGQVSDMLVYRNSKPVVWLECILRLRDGGVGEDSRKKKLVATKRGNKNRDPFSPSCWGFLTSLRSAKS